MLVRHTLLVSVCALAGTLTSAWTPATATAQTPTATFPYGLVLDMVVEKATPIVEADDRVVWGPEPRVEVFPVYVGAGNREVIMRLNLQQEGGSKAVDVDVRIRFECENAVATGSVIDVQTNVDLSWIEEIFAGDISVGREPFDQFIGELNGLLAPVTAGCDEIRAWPEGLVTFPGDSWDPFTGDSTYSTCTDGTSGRMGRVKIENGQIIAEIVPGSTPRWPDQGPYLELWVSSDGAEDHSRLYWYDPTQDNVHEGFPGNIPVGGGASSSYAIQDGFPFAGCMLKW